MQEQRSHFTIQYTAAIEVTTTPTTEVLIQQHTSSKQQPLNIAMTTEV